MDHKIKDAFGSIKAEPELMESTLAYVLASAKRKKNPGGRLARGLSLVAASIFAVLVIAGLNIYSRETAYVSIDANPSIELSLNRFDRVLEAVPQNEDGERVLSSTDLKNLNYSDALSRIIKAEQELGYLDNADMVFAVQSDDAGQREALMRESEAYASNAVGAQHTACYAVDSGEWEAAHLHGISAGKYKAIEELQQYDPTVTVEDYSHHSMRDIRQELWHHQHGSEPEAADPYSDTDEPHPNGTGQIHGDGASGGQGSGNQVGGGQGGHDDTSHDSQGAGNGHGDGH